MVAAVSATPNPNKVSSQGGAHHQNNPKRPPLLPSEADNGVVGPPPRRPKSREVTSRYLSSSCTTSSSSATSSSYSSSSSSSNSSSSRRYPSPIVSRTVPMTPMPAPSRSQSAERRRPGNAGEMSAAAKLLVASKRSLSVSFQGDSYSRKAKPAPATNNLTSSRRKATPERENSKPIIKDHQHRWPGRSRELNCSMTIRSLDCSPADKKKMGALQQQSIIMIDDSSKAPVASPRLKANPDLDNAAQIVIDAISDAGSAATSDLVASDDTESVSSGSTGAGAGAVQECCVRAAAPVRGRGPRGIVVPARFWQETTNRLQRRLPEQVSPISKNNNGLKTVAPPKLNALKKSFMDSPISPSRGVPGSRGLSSPLRCGVRPASPSKLVTSSVSSPSRGIMSPSRVRNGGVASTVNNDLGNTPSILSFAADVRRGKVGENRIGDAHVLRLLYNRHLQWRFINARADNAMMVQKVTAERSLYNAWVTTTKLRHSIKTKRIELQLLRQNLMLYSILKGQMLYLVDWDLIDWDHSNSLSGAIEALESSTLRLPMVGGARADIQNVKDAICSAVDVMQSMASSICSLLTKVDQVNPLLSELVNTTAKERALLDQCKDLLSTLTAMQVKDCSMRAHILQLRCKAFSGLTNEV